ncbi:hypothetical protein [Sorangium sp. So ce1182]|uniref:hypothetical protein n=1 Tax=Sorangium sp. So ce1182 TaxID=3133334 RepID=UPI003F5DFA48
MPRPFVITLPEPDGELRDAIARALGEEAEIHEHPPDYGLEEVKLIIEIAAGVSGVIVGIPEVVKVLGKLRDVLKSHAKPKPKRVRIKVLDGGADVVLTEVTDEELQTLAEESRKDRA